MINRAKIKAHKEEFFKAEAEKGSLRPDWSTEFKRFTSDKRNYQDAVIVLSVGPHSFRRNGITKVTNNSGGDLILASQLFGNSPKTAKSNYYTGLNLEKAKMILEIK